VTPDSPEALSRALHASVILAVRLSVLPAPDDAAAFDPSAAAVQPIIQALRSRLLRVVERGEQEMMSRRFDEVIAWWREAARTEKPLHYKAEQQFHGLMQFSNQGHESPAKATLNSMRNVDGNVACKVLGAS